MSSETERKRLKLLTNVGDKAAGQLYSSGYTLEKLAVATPSDIGKVLQTTQRKAKLLIAEAQTILEKQIQPPMLAKNYREERAKKIQWIKTGSKALDTLLGGGFKTSSTAGVSGPQASGKTQLGFGLLLYVLNELKRDAVFIETELNTFSSTRLNQMALGSGWTYPEDRVVIVPASRIRDVGTQYYQYQKVKEFVENQGFDVGIIIVDSLTALFQRKYTGRELLPDRKAELGRHLSYLEDLAKEWNALSFNTCQVIECPVSPMEAKGGFSSADVRVQFGTNYLVWGGHILRHTLGTWISLEHQAAEIWKAVVFDSSELKRDSCLFTISEKGLGDVQSKE